MSLINVLNKSICFIRQKALTNGGLIVRYSSKGGPVAAAAAATGAAAKKKKIGKLGPMMEKKEIPVETDVNKLVNYLCGGNINKTGQDIKLKPDSEYPDWLWTLNVDRIIPLEEMDPNTKQYWRRLRKMALRRNNKLSKLRKF
uniref:Large ribosomal subunit protein mL54 n=1 Tax=Glossina morsitans morsitans TaxID=37546 RepID=A0A1B0GG91_GLOMM